MKFLVLTATFFAALTGRTSGQECPDPQEIANNTYCYSTQAISFTNMNFSGTYQQVTNIQDDACSFGPKQFGGPVGPFDEEVSFHFRGPLNLKQFAVYAPGTAASKRQVNPKVAGGHHVQNHGLGHRHGRFHRGMKEVVSARDVGSEVVVTMNGKVVSWVNDWNGFSAVDLATWSKSLDSFETSVATSVDQAVTYTWFTTVTRTSTIAPSQGPAMTSSATSQATSGGSSSTSQTQTIASSASQALSAASAGAGSYSRVAYYNSETQEADSLVFLNNMGGQDSGVWDDKMGNSLSYMGANGASCAKGPEILADTMVPDITEFSIFTNKNCTSPGECGATRPGGVAYHGWDGAAKVFLMEFSMPLTGKRAPSTQLQPDMPAVWLLNTQIPRTEQYGGCSCWTSGCGEFDIFECLDSGNIRTKPTLHSTIDGSTLNWIPRPTNGTMKAAVAIDPVGSAIHIKVLPDNTDFPTTLDTATIASFGDMGTNGTVYALLD